MAAAVPIDATIYLLADHLDAALAAGEDLLKLRLDPGRARERPEDFDRRLDAFLERLKRHEAALVARVLQARRRAEEVRRPDTALRQQLDLFVSGTAPLIDAIAEFGDPSGLQFDAGSDRLVYLRSRALLKVDAPALSPFNAMAVGETYQAAGRIALGPLLDLVAALLDALDLRYDLYSDARAAATAGTGAVPAEAGTDAAVRTATKPAPRLDPDAVTEALDEARRQPEA